MQKRTIAVPRGIAPRVRFFWRRDDPSERPVLLKRWYLDPGRQKPVQPKVPSAGAG